MRVLIFTHMVTQHSIFKALIYISSKELRPPKKKATLNLFNRIFLAQKLQWEVINKYYYYQQVFVIQYYYFAVILRLYFVEKIRFEAFLRRRNHKNPCAVDQFYEPFLFHGGFFSWAEMEFVLIKNVDFGNELRNPFIRYSYTIGRAPVAPCEFALHGGGSRDLEDREKIVRHE